MSIQKMLGANPKPYGKSDANLAEKPDSYSRQIDHDVSEWEQPYGYDTNPLEPSAIERKEHHKY